MTSRLFRQHRTAQRQSPPSRLRPLNGVLMAVLLSLSATPMLSHAQEVAVAISIAKEPLADALVQLGEQASLQIFFAPELVRGLSAPAISGTLTPEQALQKLLAGTGIGYKVSGRNVTLAPAGGSSASGHEAAASGPVLAEVQVVATAEQQVKQGLGTSIITKEDLEQRPPANDLSEIIRTMPGVNLTGSGNSGAFGNQRQIDLRGMGPDNTLILIDGKPVLSRDGSFMRKTGERDTHGDSNWVPADQVESIEVIRGPAAARYGSGAAGGVVNIITKKPTDKWSGSVTAYYNNPEHNSEGNTKRTSFDLSGPLSENLSFRMYGNVAKTDGDTRDVNPVVGVVDNSAQGKGATVYNVAAGREGTRNRDLDALLHWKLTPDQSLDFQAGFSRQGNISAGEFISGTSQSTTRSTIPAMIAATTGNEIRRVYRQTASIVHKADWGALGDSRITLQAENTRTDNCQRGAAGGSEGNCAFDSSGTSILMYESKYQTYFANGELHTPLKLLGRDQVLTSGIEFRQEKLNDPSTIYAVENQTATATGAVTSATKADAYSYQRTKENSVSMYLEDNIEVTTPFILTPGLRFDHYEDYGNNWSPSLNASYELSSEFTAKGGVARVIKVPNLYQSNPYWFSSSGGNGCSTFQTLYGTGGCVIWGNPDLDPERSVNKEIGLAWNNHRGWDSSLTYFRNDYKNKIDISSADGYPDYVQNVYVSKWVNTGAAVIHGLEGSLNIPLLGKEGSQLKLFNNATYMFSSRRKSDGQPVSIIPKYTLNSTLAWHVNDQWETQLTSTVYGRQKPRTTQDGAAVASTALTQLGSYAIIGWNATYRISKSYRLGFGITNLLDKRLFRTGNVASGSTTAGAKTYNEAGRAFYATFTGSF